jgi:protein SCO1
MRWRSLLFGLLALCASATLGSLAIPDAPGSALDHEELPFYSRADLVPRWDMFSRWRRVGPIALIEASGERLTTDFFADGPTIVSFFWAGCATACPGSIELLRGIKGKPRIMLITDQPLTDRPAILADYRRRLALPANWQLTTGNPDAIYAFARRSLFTEVEARRSDGIPRHTEINYLIDRHGRLRGLYDAHSPADTVRLQTDLERLQIESGLAPRSPPV